MYFSEENLLSDQICTLIKQCPNSSRLFEEFCAQLLRGLGFENVYRRKGTEQGRDIDAQLSNFTWYFECKLVTKDVDTASFAYKFLQLDALHDEQKPDFFVLISNGSIKSIQFCAYQSDQHSL